ncbi:MAG: hypothetical protein ACYDHY_18305 [Acidiferrobacterales bacterium]
MDIRCPLCHSEDTKRLALVQAEGRSRTKGVTVGGGFGGGLSLAGMALSAVFFPIKVLFGVFVGVNRSRSATDLAAETAPPRRAPAWLMATLGLIPSFWISQFIGTRFHSDFMQSVVWTGLFFILYGGATFAAFYYNRKAFPKREASWQRTFLCQRCGANFVVAEYDPYGMNAVRSDRLGTGNALPIAEQPQARETAEAKADADARQWRERGKSMGRGHGAGGKL